MDNNDFFGLFVCCLLSSMTEFCSQPRRSKTLAGLAVVPIGLFILVTGCWENSTAHNMVEGRHGSFEHLLFL